MLSFSLRDCCTKMGAGRKTYTYTLDDDCKNKGGGGGGGGVGVGGGGGNFRGLSKSDLAGVIFGCTPQTFKECVTQLIFGLPAFHIAYVQNIGPGMPLFLFNYNDRKMHGIFQAASCGKMNINPYGWTAEGAEKTHFPAQVRVCIMKNCEPLSESAFKNIISENYYTNTHFWFELDHSQVDALRTLFLSRSNKRSSDIDSTKSSENGTWLYKKAPSSSNVWQTASAGTSLDYAEMGLDGNSSGDWTMVPPKDKDMPYGRGGDPWEESSESSDKNKEICKTIDSDDEKAAYGEMITSPTVLINNKPESVEIGPASNGTVKNSSKENRELLVLEKLKQLAINRHNSLPNPTACKCVKDDNDITIIPEQFQKYIEQMQQEIADLRGYVEKTRDEFQSAREIRELRNKNILLEQKQVEMDLEIQCLKQQVNGLEEVIKTRDFFANEDESHEQLANFEASIFLLGGYDAHSWLGTLDAYSPQTDIMRSLAPMLSERSYAAATVMDNNIYIFGGGNGSVWYETVERYDKESNSWTTCPSMTRSKGSLAGATLDNKIYALGGGNGVDYFSDVDMYDPFLGRWLPYGTMLQNRFALAGAVLGGALYALGGFDGKQYLKSVERFDPREGRWVELEEMNNKRGSLSAAVLNEKLYAVGGFDGSNFLSTVEVFDPREGFWLMVDPMACPRGYGATAVLGDYIYLIGGLGQNEYFDSIECYNEGVGWEVLSSDAVGKRSFLAAVVL